MDKCYQERAPADVLFVHHVERGDELHLKGHLEFIENWW